jgi:ketosteroid isomerase-like protein
MSRPPEDLLRDLYVAFNARDTDTLLAAMTPGVDWPNGWEGGRVEGREAVRAYWERQWAAVDSRVEATAFDLLPDGRVSVTAAQTVRALDGTLLDEGTVHHVYTFAPDGLVSRMDIED